jgi:hypothetical protein
LIGFFLGAGEVNSLKNEDLVRKKLIIWNAKYKKALDEGNPSETLFAQGYASALEWVSG